MNTPTPAAPITAADEPYDNPLSYGTSGKTFVGYAIRPCRVDGERVISGPEVKGTPQFYGIYGIDSDGTQVSVTDCVSKAACHELLTSMGIIQNTGYCRQSDPAAAFGASLSIYGVFGKEARERGEDISAAYSGADQFMRECYRAGHLFEQWACSHVNFDANNDVWPYMLEDKFGEAAMEVMGTATDLARFDESTCEEIAKVMNLTLLP